MLFAHIGNPHCWICAKPIERQTVQQIVDTVCRFDRDTSIYVLAPVVRGRKGGHKGVFSEIRREGYLRARVDGKLYQVEDKINLNKNKIHDIEVVVDRLILKGDYKERLTESIELGLKVGSGAVIIHKLQGVDHLFSEHFGCPDHPEASLDELAPRMFSFNSPYGACNLCDGLGTQMYIDPNLIVPDK